MAIIHRLDQSQELLKGNEFEMFVNWDIHCLNIQKTALLKNEMENKTTIHGNLKTPLVSSIFSK